MFNLPQIIQMMNNPQIKMLMNSKNPQQMAINMIKSSPNGKTEIGQTIIGMLERGDMKGLEQYGRNIAQSQGIDPNQLEDLMKP